MSEGGGHFGLIGSDVIWTGDHTFTGSAVLNNGASLSLGAAGNTGSIVGDLHFTRVSTLEINRANDYLYDGAISGDGNLIKNGAMNGVGFTVNRGGLLGGSGALGNTTVQSGGPPGAGRRLGHAHRRRQPDPGPGQPAGFRVWCAKR